MMPRAARAHAAVSPNHGTPARTPGEGPRAFTALGNDLRIEILSALAVHDRTVTELACDVKAHPATLRYHLGLLLTQRLIEEVRPEARGVRGRPPVRYRAARHASVPGFPPRHYEFIAEASLQILIETLGEEQATRYLREKGKAFGQAIIDGVADRAGVAGWTPEGFGRHVLNGLFRDFGMIGEVLATGPHHITYRAFTCPFLELAEKMPKLVCDSMDVGFHDGVDAALGARTERLTCMGHGSAYCEYRMTWPARNRAKGKGQSR